MRGGAAGAAAAGAGVDNLRAAMRLCSEIILTDLPNILDLICSWKTEDKNYRKQENFALQVTFDRQANGPEKGPQYSLWGPFWPKDFLNRNAKILHNDLQLPPTLPIFYDIEIVFWLREITWLRERL